MSSRIHKHRHHKFKGSEKKIIIAMIPISIIIAFLIGGAIRGVPRLYWNFISNFRNQEIISHRFLKGSAVRTETPMREQYEAQWRKDSLETWSKTYDNMLQNRNPNEVKDIEQKLKETKKGIY